MRICCILDPFHAPATGVYKDGHVFGLTICGALSGAIASFSMVHGFGYGPDFPGTFWEDTYKSLMSSPNFSAKERTFKFMDILKDVGYFVYLQIVTRFQARLGTTDCFELRKPYCKGDPYPRKHLRFAEKLPKKQQQS